MLETSHLLLPGPTPIPEPIQRAMFTAVTDHRGPAFSSFYHDVLADLRRLFQVGPDGGVAVIPAAGTGGLEAAAENFLTPDDRVLVVESGLFGQRFREIIEAQGVTCDVVQVPWGESFDSDTIYARVEAASYRAVVVTHNETSTGVLQPVESLAHRLGTIPDKPLLVVDSISGVPSIPLDMESSGVDVVVAGSQKGFMCPPGLAIIAASGRAIERLKARPSRGFYFRLESYYREELPYTPPLSLWYGLGAALEMLHREGAEARLARHVRLRDMTRAFCRAGGFPPRVEADSASPTVTAISVPSHLNPSALRHTLNGRGLQIAGGLGRWHDSMLRIGHVGALTPSDLWGGLGILATIMERPEEALGAAFRVQQEDVR